MPAREPWWCWWPVLNDHTRGNPRYHHISRTQHPEDILEVFRTDTSLKQRGLKRLEGYGREPGNRHALSYRETFGTRALETSFPLDDLSDGQ